MPSRKRRQVQSIATKSTELAFAAPKVIAHRVARMALSGPVVSARDRKEFHLMWAEKVTAFAQSWHAMALQIIRANQEIWASFFSSFWQRPSIQHPSAHALARLQSATLGILSKGLTPVHRKATANAERLARTKWR